MIKVIEVSAPWCAQCKGFKPIFDSVKKELETDDIQFSEVNADDDDDFVEKYKIQMERLQTEVRLIQDLVCYTHRSL